MENSEEDTHSSEKMRKFRPLTVTASAAASVPPPKKPHLSTNGGGAQSSSSHDSEQATGGSESMWMPQSDRFLYLQTRLIEGADPRTIIQSITSSNSPIRSSRFQNLHEMIPSHVSQDVLWRFLFEIFSEPTPRQKLPNINTLDDVVQLIRGAHKVLVVAGAGLSVSCGIPDFRSKDGLYTRVATEFPQLRDPQLIFDSDFFKEDPRPFFRFAKHLFVPSTGGEQLYKPSPAHYFISELEKRDKLLRVYTQNIDGLERAAGLSHDRLIACHGSFETSTCTECHRKVDSTEIADHIKNGTVAYCASKGSEKASSNQCPGIMKPEIVFFGESLPSRFHCQMAIDRNQPDLLIVFGTSLRVRPVSLIPFAVPPNVPQVLINRERLRHMNFDVELLGDCDVVIQHLRDKLDWKSENSATESSSNKGELPPFAFYAPNTYIFASSGATSAPQLDLSDSEEEDSLDSDEDEWSKSSSPSPQPSPHPQPVEKRVLVKVRPDPPPVEAQDQPKTSSKLDKA